MTDPQTTRDTIAAVTRDDLVTIAEAVVRTETAHRAVLAMTQYREDDNPTEVYAAAVVDLLLADLKLTKQ